MFLNKCQQLVIIHKNTSGKSSQLRSAGVESENAVLNTDTAKTTVFICDSEEKGEQQYDIIYNQIPAIGLHHDALIPNGVIDANHVNKIMGYKIKSNEERTATINQWQAWKKAVRGWAGFHIKNLILTKAKTIPTNDENMITPTVNGQLVAKFLDIRKWWASAPVDCRKSEATFTYLAFGMWEKFWEKKLEEQFMNTFGWSYDNDVKEDIQKKCNRSGYEMKGCIAKNISHVKGELVKSLQKKGRQAEHGKTIKKRRCKEEASYDKGNYIKRRAVTVTVAVKADVEAGIKEIKGEEEAEEPPAMSHNMKEIEGEEEAEEPPPVTSHNMIDDCSVDIDTIDDFVIYSSPRKHSAAAAVSMKKGSDKAIASVGWKVKPTTKNKSNKQQRRVPSPPTPPPCVPSEYELK